MHTLYFINQTYMSLFQHVFKHVRNRRIASNVEQNIVFMCSRRKPEIQEEEPDPQYLSSDPSTHHISHTIHNVLSLFHQLSTSTFHTTQVSHPPLHNSRPSPIHSSPPPTRAPARLRSPATVTRRCACPGRAVEA